MVTSVILFGEGVLVTRIAQWFNENPAFALISVVPVIPEGPRSVSLRRWAEANKVHSISSGRYTDIPQLRDSSWQLDLAFSVAYKRILPDLFLDRCGRALNLHNAPLPRYRGVAPMWWALRNHEHVHGVSIHQITSVIDGGPIVGQKLFPIYPSSDTLEHVAARALECGWDLFKRVMPILDTITPIEQDASLATYYSRQDLASVSRNL